jgi:hypothetical protein
MIIFDIEALGELTTPPPSRTATAADRRNFWTEWACASLDREADFLQADKSKAWEDGQ